MNYNMVSVWQRWTVCFVIKDRSKISEKCSTHCILLTELGLLGYNFFYYYLLIKYI